MTKIVYQKLLVVCVLLFFVSVLGHSQNVERQIQIILDSFYKAHPESVGIMLHVESPQVSWTDAVGYSAKNSKTSIDKEQPALIASMTKTYVAAAVLKLAAKGHFELDDSIVKMINSQSRKWLKKDGYKVNKITVRQLLSHTSGIQDYVNDSYFAFVDNNPQFKWTRSRQVRLATMAGDPLGKPGEEFSYADVNYLLLTEVIENFTNQPFQDAIRRLLSFEAYGLTMTWFLELEYTLLHSKEFVHQYWDKYQWDSHDLNPSWDMYGGGGIAATVKDAARFYHLLFNGKIIEDDLMRSEMTSPVIKDSNYCLGIRKLSFHGYEAYYHGGFWGTDVMYLPKLDASIAVFTLQKEARGINAEISWEIVKLLERNKN